MPDEKKKSLAVKKEEKSVPAAKKLQSGSIQEFNNLLDTFRSELMWDPFRGFEWTR